MGEMARRGRYPAEVRERAVRMVFEHQREYESQWAAIVSIAGKLGMTSETLRKWVRQAEIDGGARSGVSSAEAERVKVLEREVKELRRANEDTTDCPRRWFSGSRSGGAGAASAGGPVPGAAGLFASPRRVASLARAARWQPLADSRGLD